MREFTIRGYGETALDAAIKFCTEEGLRHGCGFGPHDDTGEWVLTVRGNTFDQQNLAEYGRVELS